MSCLPHERPDIIRYSQWLAEGFYHWTGQLLLPVCDDLASALYYAPFALVAHGTQPDPVFCYANLTAQRLWNMDWHDFTCLPSRLSAEPDVAGDRQRLLDMAARQGYVEHYQGVRVTRDGKRFMIRDTLLWNVMDGTGAMQGQAARINAWEWL